MITQSVSIAVTADETVSGVVSIPDGFQSRTAAGVIIAHGAGNDMDNPLIVYLSGGLAAAGYLALRFNFPYKEKGRKSPDSQKKLILTWQRVFEFLKTNPEFGTSRIVAAGKSMGGRVASQMIADDLLAADGLILLGYPLHAPGKKDQLRDAHLYQIALPMLFFAGTRDSLCDLDLLQAVLKNITASKELEIVEGGDHSFNMLKSSKISQEAVYGRILEKTIQWLKR
jgi:predicted alpha/beta-hydrolase family hydrolase